ncbi:MAG: PQQ-binding-like beta-propeller repeat protein [Pirellulales bacterium]
MNFSQNRSVFHPCLSLAQDYIESMFVFNHHVKIAMQSTVAILLTLVVACTHALPSPPALEKRAAADYANWPLFRGDSSGSGVAAGGLPEDLEVLWRFKVTDSFFDATAVIADNVVYIGDVDQHFYALDLSSGKLLWKYKVEIGFTAAAAVRDGRVYVGDSDGVFYCLNARNGELIWKHATEAEINSSANFFADSVLIGSQDGTLYRFGGKDGKILWKYTIEASGGIQCSPTLAKDRAFVCGCDNKLHVIDVEKGESIATMDVGSPTLATPAILGDNIFFGTEGSQVVGIDSRGPTLLWRYEHPKRKMSYRSSAAVTDELVVIGGRNKAVEALDVKTGERQWTFPTRGRVDSSPVIAGNRVFVGSADGRLYGLDLKTGEENWSYDAGGGFVASPAIANGRLVIGNQDGILFCFGKKE